MVELIPKEAPKIPRWLNVLFYLSLIFLLFAIIWYFHLNSSFKKAQKNLEDVKEVILTGKTSEKISLEREILNYDKKLKDFAQLSNQHLENLKIFTILEKNTHPKVWFTRFNLNAREKLLTLSGETQSFESLGQQVLILKSIDLIKEVNLDKTSIGKEGKINFDLTITFSQ